MVLFGFSKEEMDNAVNKATAEAQQTIAEKEKELETLKAEKAVIEEEMKKKTSELEQSLSAASAAHEEELDKIQKLHADELAIVRKESAIQTQQMIEFIDTRKKELDKKTDRELLLSAVMALDGYAGRLERVEKNMEFHDMMSRLAEMKKEFSDSLESTESVLLEKLKAKEILERIWQMKIDVASQINENTGDLTGKIKSMNETLTELMGSLKLSEKLGALSDQIDGLYQTLSEKVDELEKNVAKKIDAYDITGSLESIRERVDGLAVSTHKIMGLVGELKSGVEKIESIKEKVDEIQSNVDPFGAYSTYTEVNSMTSKLESIESEIHNLGYSIEAAKDAAERAADHNTF